MTPRNPAHGNLTHARKGSWLLATFAGALVLMVAIRYAAALASGVDHMIVLRTYAFWAIVALPVAMLADLLLRTIADYRMVRVAVARVQTALATNH